MKFGRLTLIKEIKNSHKTPSHRKWLCLCDCGKNSTPKISNLKTGVSYSCGCWRAERFSKIFKTHGMTKTREYITWLSMKARCKDKKHKDWKYYGGRGVKVCSRWVNSFENFYKDMGPRPKDKSLDRINPYSNYKPSNCRWATLTEQANNKRQNK